MKDKILNSFFNNLGIDPLSVAKPRYRESDEILFIELIESIYDNDGKYKEICSSLEISKTTYFNTMKKLFPKARVGGKASWKTFILNNSDYKACPKCSIKLRSEFPSNKSKLDGLAETCQACRPLIKKGHYENNRSTYASYNAKRRASMLQRSPIWANHELIKKIYNDCPKGYHVDHIYPLQGDLVSGLHVETNLQYLPALENLSKGNKMPGETYVSMSSKTR